MLQVAAPSRVTFSMPWLPPAFQAVAAPTPAPQPEAQAELPLELAPEAVEEKPKAKRNRKSRFTFAQVEAVRQMLALKVPTDLIAAAIRAHPTYVRRMKDPDFPASP